MLAAMAMMVSLFAVVAYAAQITGTDALTISLSNRNDQIHGLLGEDYIDATDYDRDGTGHTGTKSTATQSTLRTATAGTLPMVVRARLLLR